jgi:excinuclease ABC subunit B
LPLTVAVTVTSIRVEEHWLRELTPPATQYALAAEETAAYAHESPALLMKKIKKLEETMYRNARDLEFEEAAKVRDEIQRIRQFGLGLLEVKAG